jgi:uncharacterized protein YuzE
MKRSDIKLPFGLQQSTGLIVHISEVERGRMCNCVCPSCQVPLNAHKGEILQHHFKHDTGDECAGGLESAIHLAAKQLIKKHKQITLPERIAEVSVQDARGRSYKEKSVFVKNKEIRYFDSVEEVELHGMKADIFAKSDNQPLIIEIFYRHKVDDQKREKIKTANISAIEIDLSDLEPDNVKNWHSFWLSINEIRRIEWLHHAKYDEEIKKLENSIALKMQDDDEKYWRRVLMKLSKNKKLNVAYIQFRKGFSAKTVKVMENILIDLDSKGRVLGIEVLDLTELAPALKLLNKGTAEKRLKAA